MIHKYSLNGYNIVLDVHSGGVHVVDDLAYNLLDDIQEPMSSECPEFLIKKHSDYSCEKVIEAYDELYAIYKNKMLFSSDDYKSFSGYFGDAPIKAMCLHVSHDCNLRCKYCFASTGDFGQGRKLMSVETGKQAIDFLIENSKGRGNIELDFFGGEPLMNFNVVKQIVKYARSKETEYDKRFRFTVTTNGMLLDKDKADYINKEMSNCVLSLDGRPEVNNNMRPRVDGSGSYDSIVDKYRYLVDNRGDKDYYVRGTFTKNNLDFSKDVIHIHNLGFDQLSVEPVIASDSHEYSLTDEDLPKIFEEYENLAKEIIKRKDTGINFFHFMIDLNQGPCAIKRIRGCGCGNEYVAVDPEGDIYPCHQFVGMDEWKMGNLHARTLNLEMKKAFAETTIYNKKECEICWAKFYCSGGCNANNFTYQGDILKPHKISCEMEKKRLECAIMIKAALV